MESIFNIGINSITSTYY